MKLPDFLIVGTARAGTTALHYYLRQHPGLYLPAQKEPCFFCFNDKKINYKKGKFAFAVTDKDKYLQLFKKAEPNQKTGEISTPYLFLHEQTIASIRKHYSTKKLPSIVIILRNPVDRAYSQYLWKVRDGRENLTFDEALRQEKSRIKENYSFDYFYAHRSLYYDAVRDYKETFSAVRIFLYDDFKDIFTGTMSKLCDFLDVDHDFVFKRKEKFNSSEMPRFSSLGRIMTVESKFKFKMLGYLPDRLRAGIKEQFIRLNATGEPPPPMSDFALSFLNDFFREDLRKLQALTGIDLTHWEKL